jgi:hypothetical protein
MNVEEQKAAIAAFKERKVEAGIYAVQCGGSGQTWVGSAPDISTIKNRLWFTLRQGQCLHQSLQDAWIAYGAEAFTFELIERLEDENIGFVRDRILRELLQRCADERRAIRI